MKDVALIGLLWVCVFLMGGLFVVDVIGALETEPDECFAYGYGGGPGGYGCNPLLGDAYFEASQTDDLVDRQIVHIDGFLFDANKQFGIVQCSGVAFSLPDTPSGIDACDLSNVALGSTDAGGELSTDVRVRRIINTPNSGEVDCALPDSACVIAGGVLGADLYSTTEAAYVSIQFDPDVPPAPAPTVTLEVVQVDADSVTVSVECLNATSLSIDAQLQQQIGDLWGSAYGSEYSDGTPACAEGPAEYEISLAPGNRRIGRGDVSYYVSAYAYDGYESAYAVVEGEFTLRRTPRPTYIVSNDPGVDLDIELVGLSGRGDDQRVRIAVTCDRPTQYAQINVNVSQWSGLDRVYGYGNSQLDECDGRVVVEVPLQASNGRLRSGTAQLETSVYVQSYDEVNEDYYFDQARLADKIRLRGSLVAALPEVMENPDSRITIRQVTRDGISGEISCDEPVEVDLQANAQQYQGWLIRSAYAYSESGLIECDGVVAFDLEWNTRLQRGETAVSIYASGYIVSEYEPPDYPVVSTTTGPMPTTTTLGSANGDSAGAESARFGLGDPAMPTPQGDQLASAAFDEAIAEGHYYDYVWSDTQGKTVRIRR